MRCSLSKDIKVRTRMMRCSGSNNSIDGETTKCWAKSFSRNLTTMNAHVNLTRFIYSALVSWIEESFCFKILNLDFRFISICNTEWILIHRFSPSLSTPLSIFADSWMALITIILLCGGYITWFQKLFHKRCYIIALTTEYSKQWI